MRLLTCTPVKPAIALASAVVLLSACSSSGSDPSSTVDAIEGQSTVGPEVSVSGQSDLNDGEALVSENVNGSINVADSGEMADDADEVIEEADGAGSADAVGSLDESPDGGATEGSTTGGSVPEARLSTTVNFNITVPAFMSNALQVSVEWGDENFTAGWDGDEFWSVSGVLPSNTQNDLVVTFADDNGAVLLARFEQSFTTGFNEFESFQINVDQFNSDQFDDDRDGISNLDEQSAGANASEPARVLLFSETRDFRHDSTDTALTALEQITESAGMQSDRANDSAGVFTEANLANYDAVVWVQTSGDVLDANEQLVFENYIRAGGGYAGIHAASFTEYEWPWYGALVGAYFDTHPDIQTATQDVEDNSHASTTHLGSQWIRIDEWYDYRTNPRAQVNVLLSLDESSYTGGAMGDDHPSAWYHDYDGGRSWYTGGGHTLESYAEPDFRAHLLGGLRYATGRE